MQVVKQFLASCSKRNSPILCPVKNIYMPTITPHREGTVTYLTCAYDPGPSPQIPSPPPWLSSSLTPYPISLCWPICHYYFTAYSSCYDAGRPIAAATGKSTNRVTINASPGSRVTPPPTKRTSQIFTMNAQKRKRLNVKRGNQTSYAPSSTSNSSPAWRTVAVPCAITTKAERSGIYSHRRRARCSRDVERTNGFF